MWASAFSLWLGVSQWTQQLPPQEILPTAAINAKPFVPMTSAASNSQFELKTGSARFSPKDLISLPNPGLAIVNPGEEDLFIISVSQYSFEDKKKNLTTYVQPIDPQFKATPLPILSGGDAFWLDSRTLAHVVGDRIYAVSLEYKTKPEYTSWSVDSSSPYLIGIFPEGSGPYGFKFNGEVLVFVSKVYADYDLKTIKEQDEAWDNRGTTAMVYDSLFVRHWDTYRGPKSQKLFSVALTKGVDGKWALGTDYYTPLKGTKHSTPVEPFGGTDDFDVSKTHIAYTTKDPEVNEALHTRQNVYIVPIKGGAEPKHLTSGEQGTTGSITFSKQGDKLAWTQQFKDGYESDRARIAIYDLEKDVRFMLNQNWDRSASEIAFSPDGKSLFFVAADEANEKVFALEIPKTPAKSDEAQESQDVPIELTTKHSAHGLQPLSGNRLVFVLNSLTSPHNVYLLYYKNLQNSEANLNRPALSRTLKEHSQVDQLTRFGEKQLKGRGLDAGESFWFEGAEGHKVQGWALKPAGYDEAASGTKWPAIFLIHGGPQGAWEDGWSFRWNPNVFAGQGYYVIAVNPTGSTSFGQNFTDAITEDWGGKPFVDLKKGWDYALKTYNIDPERTVAAGASWGGFAINWIQGHPEYGFGFKALVCHDGIFDTRYGGFATDELYFWNHDFGGKPWEEKARKIAEKFNPANFVHKWSTPQLIFHGGRDYRLAETEGLGVFNALQALGIPSRLVLFPDENHWVLRPENSYRWHYELFKWVDEYIGEGASSKTQ